MPVNKIVLIGAGNVATQIGKTLHRKGVKILQVMSRTQKSAENLASMIGAEAISDFSEINRDADLYLISVTDDAISEIISKISPLHGIVAHTSGAVEMDILKGSSKKFGVFYPLQTFSKFKETDFSSIPVCTEASDDETKLALADFASKISNDIRFIDSYQRSQIHLAAVFVNNFTNYMFAIGNKILEKNNIPFDILYPLINETVEKIKHQNPHQAQTGPAIRNDKKVISKHIQMLHDEPKMQKLYQLISEQISKSANPKNK
jgi:predicted short-subunit dehydrogenase-like oxidoreductase (DUF2520 family)